MNRLYTDIAKPGQGAVFRTLPGGVCYPPPVPVVITAPGCRMWPIADNNFGALPTVFAPDVEIDTHAFDNRFSSLSGITPDPVFTDLWAHLSPDSQTDVFYDADGCYCPGVGVTRPGLLIGRPRFPIVNPLPFFGMVSAVTTVTAAVNRDNAEDKRYGNCCPTEDADPEEIEMQVVDGKIKLVHIARQEVPKLYRTSDAHKYFLAQFGFPKYCCLPDPCDIGEDTAQFVQRWLHFPGWMSLDRDPYSSDNPEEPVGILPVVVDIQCDTNTGDLYIYRSELLFYDGRLFDVRWDTAAPRAPLEDITKAPKNPNANIVGGLDYNMDYHGSSLIEIEGINWPDYCHDNCVDAAKELGIDACAPECLGVCADGYTFVDTYVYTGTSHETADEAVASARAKYTTDHPCSPKQSDPLPAVCYIRPLEANKWEVGLMKCCKN